LLVAPEDEDSKHSELDLHGFEGLVQGSIPCFLSDDATCWLHEEPELHLTTPCGGVELAVDFNGVGVGVCFGVFGFELEGDI